VLQIILDELLYDKKISKYRDMSQQYGAYRMNQLKAAELEEKEEPFIADFLNQFKPE